MSRLVRKAHHLVLDGRAVARSGAVYPAAVYRRAVEILSDYLVCLRVCVNDVAGQLICAAQLVLIAARRERDDVFVALLHLEPRKIYAVSRDARRRSGLEALQGDPLAQQCLFKPLGWKHAVGTRRVLNLADYDLAAQICAGRYDNCLYLPFGTEAGYYRAYGAVLYAKVYYLRLNKAQSGLMLESFLHYCVIQRAVCLNTL